MAQRPANKKDGLEPDHPYVQGLYSELANYEAKDRKDRAAEVKKHLSDLGMPARNPVGADDGDDGDDGSADAS